MRKLTTSLYVEESGEELNVVRRGEDIVIYVNGRGIKIKQDEFDTLFAPHIKGGLTIGT